MTTPTIEEAKINMEAAARILVGSFTSEVSTFQSLAVLKRAIKELDEARAQQPDTRPSSPIADRLADALKALLEEANAYASLMPASEEGSPSGEAEATLAEYDAQRSSADGWVSVEERLPEEGALVLASGWPGKNPRFKRWMNTAIFKNGQFIDGDDDDPEAEDDLLSFLDVTHWMPVQLPQPPKGATT